MGQKFNLDEKFIFSKKLKKTIITIGIIGVLIFGLGLLLDSLSDHHEKNHGDNPVLVHVEEDVEIHKGDTHEVNAHTDNSSTGHDGYSLLKRVKVNLWVNSVFFTGLALAAFFFFAVQYVAMSGWPTVLVRIPMAFGNYLPMAFFLTGLIFFFSYHDIFHWSHHGISNPESSNYDPIIAGKSGFLNLPFFSFRLIAFFSIWILFYYMITKTALKEDLLGGNKLFRKLIRLSIGFIIFFALSTSMAAWDWVMSIDTHWYSTMIGWYAFASWFVAALAAITLLVVYLKSIGYLAFVNENHLHDLGKFVFAFSIFWTYIWFSQYLLIYYANIPEETVYFYERMENSFYFKILIVILLSNFFFPFLVLMTRDAKRKIVLLKIVCVVVIFGHWLDFFLMIMPGTMRENGNFGFVEIGLAMVFLALFIFIILNKLAKHNIVPKNHPMLQESLNHHT